MPSTGASAVRFAELLKNSSSNFSICVRLLRISPASTATVSRWPASSVALPDHCSGADVMSPRASASSRLVIAAAVWSVSVPGRLLPATMLSRNNKAAATSSASAWPGAAAVLPAAIRASCASNRSSDADPRLAAAGASAPMSRSNSAAACNSPAARRSQPAFADCRRSSALAVIARSMRP